jgi:diacylglycerol kinase
MLLSTAAPRNGKVASGSPAVPASEVAMTAVPPPTLMADAAEPEAPRPRRSWAFKFRCAFRGLKLGVRGHSSFFVHFFFAALVVVAALMLHCDALQWCVLLGCIGLVLTAELFNSALETLFRGLDEATKERVWPCLDVAAGAVLLASLLSAVIGTIVFASRLAALLFNN